MFSIDTDKNIQWVAERGEHDCFFSRPDLLALADLHGWTRQDLEAIWNSFVGVSPFGELRPVKKFRNRPYGVAQIWKAIQRLAPTDGATTDQMEAKEPAPTRKARTKKQRKPKPAVTVSVNGFREGTKAAEVVRLLQRERGATQAELMEKMGWQPHSVRGFMSTLGSKHGLAVTSEKHETKGLTYRIA